MKVLLLFLAAALTKVDIDTWMESLSNWGRWGKDDELGALNLITPQKRKQAAGLVREGFSVSLAHDAIKEKADDSPGFEHRMIETGERPEAGSSADVFSVQYHGFTATHLDALCHIFYKGKMFNGYPQQEVTSRGARKLAVNRARNGIFTRAVLMDMPRLLGKKYLEGSRAIRIEDLEAWEKKAGVKVGPGDVILIRTGRWARRAAERPWPIMKDSAGLHASCLPWLKKRDIAVMGSDLATDVMPSGVEDVALPVHQVLVVAMGVPILDNLDLELVSEAAAARQRWEFLLTAAPLAVEGATGSPINPIATF
ncbi:MAG: cyclase family protein [Acidobacteria bacterium]|nr:cyclase family protein [Acidobacteriota bacterium]